MNKKVLVISMTAAIATLTGCGANSTRTDTSSTTDYSATTSTISQEDNLALQNQLNQSNSVISARESQIATLKRQLAESQAATVAAASAALIKGSTSPRATSTKCALCSLNASKSVSVLLPVAS